MQDIRYKRDSGSIANTQICFEVRALNSTSPPSHRRIFTNASTQDFPHREPPLRIWQIQIRSIQLLSPTTQPLHKRQGTTTITSHQRDKTLSQTTTITSTLRGIDTKPTQSPLTRGIPINTITSTLRGIPKAKKDYNSWRSQRSQITLVITKTTNQFSHQKQNPIDKIDMIDQV